MNDKIVYRMAKARTRPQILSFTFKILNDKLNDNVFDRGHP